MFKQIDVQNLDYSLELRIPEYLWLIPGAVSYSHLDVYKRQHLVFPYSAFLILNLLEYLCVG